MPTRKASATWNGGLRTGNGNYRGETGISGNYSFGSRFESAEKGTNPEELLAAAEASCFSMALSGNLEKNGTPPTKVETSAACTVEKVDDKMTITRMELRVRGSVPNIDAATFTRIANETKEGCPVSRALTGVRITVDAELA